jgi:hypothetical protein
MAVAAEQDAQVEVARAAPSAPPRSAGVLISPGQQHRTLADAGAHEVAQLLQPRIGDPVAHVLAVAPARDRQPVEVLRDVRHRHAGPPGQLAHAQLAVVVQPAGGT